MRKPQHPKGCWGHGGCGYFFDCSVTGKTFALPGYCSKTQKAESAKSKKANRKVLKSFYIQFTTVAISFIFNPDFANILFMLSANWRAYPSPLIYTRINLDFARVAAT